MLEDQGYQVGEEEVFPCLNNMGEPIFPPYQADLVVTKRFIVELDPDFHDSHIHSVKDDHRDKNIFREYIVKTARVNPDHVLDENLVNTIIPDIEHQLKDKKYLEITVEKRSRKKRNES